ncbi:MAG: UDP-N-acetylmuramoyl-L-alanine--D-glutamate ligase, partial [Endomicrobiia bacterium]
MKKKVSVLGLGRTGVSVANLLYSSGYDVFVSEILPLEKIKNSIKLLNPNIKYETGIHSNKVLDAEFIVKSPGIPKNIPILIEARKKKIEILSELEVAFNNINPKLIIAITGTNGKTTVTTLIGEIFKNSGADTIVAGNIGTPLSDFVQKITRNTVVVLEVSSYQLENIKKFRPDISCVLNITPDHLEHHLTMEEYISAKKNIFINQTKNDYCILNFDDEITRSFANLCKSKVFYFSYKNNLKEGAFYDGEKFNININNRKEKFAVSLKIPGRHNIENAVVSAIVAYLCNVPIDIIVSTLNNFNGVEHRLEFVKEINGVRYINDSKSTNVGSTSVALEAFQKNKNIILIMGGRDKGSPYTPLIPLVKEKVKHLLLIGEAATRIESELKGSTEIFNCGNLFNAVKYAREIAKTGDIVLLSPGCSSFDQFENFEHRGKEFKKL